MFSSPLFHSLDSWFDCSKRTILPNIGYLQHRNELIYDILDYNGSIILLHHLLMIKEQINKLVFRSVDGNTTTQICLSNSLFHSEEQNDSQCYNHLYIHIEQ